MNIKRGGSREPKKPLDPPLSKLAIELIDVMSSVVINFNRVAPMLTAVPGTPMLTAVPGTPMLTAVPGTPMLTAVPGTNVLAITSHSLDWCVCVLFCRC